MVVIQLTSFGSEFNLRILRNGKHTVSIYNQTQTNNVNYFQFAGLTGSSFLLTVKDQFTNEVIFNNYVNIPEGSTVNAELDTYNNLNIKNTNYPTNTNNGGTIGNVNYGGSQNGYGNNGYGNNAYGNDNHCGTNHGNHNNNGNHYGHNNPNNPHYNNNYNNNTYFNQFITNLKNEGFDSNRLKSAKAYANANMLSAAQVNEIAKTFTFDSNRLTWAKYAYNKCYDKQNYFLLEDSFTFSSNYNDLLNYISNQ